MSKKINWVKPYQLEGKGLHECDKPTKYARKLNKLAVFMQLSHHRLTSTEIRQLFGLHYVGQAMKILSQQGFDIKRNLLQLGIGRFVWAYHIPDTGVLNLPDKLREIELSGKVNINTIIKNWIDNNLIIAEIENNN